MIVGLRARAGAAIAALGVASALALGGCATTGSVQGKVSMPGRGKGAPSEAVITASPARDTVEARGQGQADVEFVAGRISPNVLLVDPGTKVHFRNRDTVFHNAFSVSPENRFDAGSIGPGKERAIRFDHPGIVNVFCELHPQEASYIVVAPRKFSTRPDAGGNYMLAGLAPGPYAIRAWHPSLGSQTRRIDLPPRGHVTVDFRY